MGDVISITDAQGNEIVQYDYDPWGKCNFLEPMIADKKFANDIANINPIRYRGYYYDNETGYYYLQSRYYDPDICRFINADLPEFIQALKNIITGINMFTYCNNNSVNNTDPFGLFSLQFINNIILFTVQLSSLQLDKKRYLYWKINIVKSSYGYLKQISGKMYCSNCSVLKPKDYANCPISFTSRDVCYATGASCHHFSTPAKGNKVKVGWYNVVIRLVAYTYKCPDTFEVVKLR